VAKRGRKTASHGRINKIFAEKGVLSIMGFVWENMIIAALALALVVFAVWSIFRNMRHRK